MRKVHARSAIVPSKIPSIDYVINPYLGCGFGCRFCYASFMARYVGLEPSMWGTFAFPKEGLIQALIKQLKKPQKYQGKTILIGSVMDPYQPVESRYRLTRSILEVFLRSGLSLNLRLLTRSTLVLRDVDLLAPLGVGVGISISVMREDYFRDVEPVSPPVEARIDVIRRLREEGVNVSAFVAPVFPDSMDVLESVLERLKEEDIPVMLVELLAPWKNPLFKTLPLYRTWSRLIRREGIFQSFENVIRRHYPDVHVVRHGWA